MGGQRSPWPGRPAGPAINKSCRMLREFQRSLANPPRWPPNRHDTFAPRPDFEFISRPIAGTKDIDRNPLRTWAAQIYEQKQLLMPRAEVRKNRPRGAAR